MFYFYKKKNEIQKEITFKIGKHFIKSLKNLISAKLPSAFAGELLNEQTMQSSIWLHHDAQFTHQTFRSLLSEFKILST